VTWNRTPDPDDTADVARFCGGTAYTVVDHEQRLPEKSANPVHVVDHLTQ
jgi:hypothetical protein